MVRELGGLAVLSVGALASVAVLVVGVLTLLFVVRRRKTVLGKWAVGSVATLVMIGALGWDELAGRLYFNHLCKTGSTVRVHKEVRLPAGYWTQDGKPRFLRPNGDLDTEMLGHRFSLMAKSEPISDALRINALTFVLLDKVSSVPVGEVSTYGYFGGWFKNMTSLHPVGLRCANAPRSYDEVIALAAMKPQPR
jgi:hypothetical protein